jgi:hypothetical protein
LPIEIEPGREKAMIELSHRYGMAQRDFLRSYGH